jgi:hypothetical protein
MTELYGYTLEKVFYGFIRRDPDLLRAIDAFEGAIAVRGNALEFSLPALYEFVCCYYELASGHEVSTGRRRYLRFRKALYENSTNSWLMPRGGRVDLETPNRNHDLVLYKLVHVEHC